jgi:hypothetical protein
VVALWVILPTTLPFARALRGLVGGTTARAEAGLAADGTYYLFAWWREDGRTPVTPETYHALYWCEHYMITVAYAFVLLTLPWLYPVFQRLKAPGSLGGPTAE